VTESIPATDGRTDDAAPVANERLPQRIDLDPALPISAHRDEILDALRAHSVIVVCGATASGKSTQLPKLCLAAGRGVRGMIGHTQPRRIAARGLASRIAFELGTQVGRLVGYKVRFNDRTGRDCRIKLMTDGILLKELESDRTLRRYDTLIIDEAHERSLNVDLLLGVLKGLVARRPDLKVIVTSATIDPGKFSRFFDGAPVIEVSGRSFPVEVRYRPLIPEPESSPESDETTELSLPEGIVRAVRELGDDARTSQGDVLVFLPGEKHIREAAEAVQNAKLPRTEVLPLYARLSAREQERIFAPHPGRRIVLATNVAETSLTVPGIRAVIDSGLARISRYSVRGKVQRLPIEPVSKASADQRKGRCGREAEGICIRLYAERDFEQREAFTPPEVLRTNLASVILRMAALGLGEPESFPFLDAPDTRLVNDGVRLLQELEAMDAQRRVTGLGRRLATLPLDPRLGRMLLAAERYGCLAEMQILAAFLAGQDPRERPAELQKLADERHALFADRRSDFVAVLNLWRAFHEQAGRLSGNQLRKWCREHFLSFLRMREWQDLHGQLQDAVADLGLRAGSGSTRGGYANLHRAILTGCLGSVGRLDDRREYSGPRGVRFIIAPGTPLAKRPPPWVVAANLLETTRLYARMVAAVEPACIEAASGHLLKRDYHDAHWLESKGYVAAYESVTVYGLTLVPRRRVSFGPIAPDTAREIFAREALVEGHARIAAPFLTANRSLREEIETMEAKIRRRDLLVDERAQVEFYLARLPPRIDSRAAFERWLAQAEPNGPHRLFMSRSNLMRREAPEVTPENFPDQLEVAGHRLPLRYRFEPDAPDDGVTLVVPEPLLEALNADRLAWLVPGRALEKITALLRALPKPLRRALVPVPEQARAACDALAGSELGFHEGMALWITRRIGETVTAADLAALPLDAHLQLNVRIVDAEDRVLAESRDIAALKRRFRIDPGTAGARHGSRAGGDNESSPVLHRSWDFGELAATRTVAHGSLELRVHPALEDRTTGTALVERRTPEEADALSRRGIARLAMLALPQQVKSLRRRLAEDRELVLLSQSLALEKPVADALLERAFRDCFVPEDAPLPRDRPAFERHLDARRSELSEQVERLAVLVRALLAERHTIGASLDALRAPAFQDAVADVRKQLEALFPPDFPANAPREWLEQMPRYLEAISRRLAKLAGNVDRDAALARRVRPFQEALEALANQPATSGARGEIARLRWMIEELRVSLFAQELRTKLRVSEQRLAEQVAHARAAVQGG
jgi:ATP-dependent helicase HrpA